MAELEIRILGLPEIKLNGSIVNLSRRKAVALLAYLASSGGQRRRSTLAEFFWPDLENERALAALRRTLRSLRKHLGARFVVADRSSIGLNHDLLWVDVQELRDLASKVRSDVTVGDLLTEIGRRIALYRGELLEGFSLPDGDRFEDWLLLEREVVKRDFYLLLDRLATEHLRAGDIDTAIDVLHQHLHLNPHAEDVHRRVMELYARGGRRSEALQQFHRCAKLLKEGLGVFPGEQTLKLFEGIREGRIGPSNEAQGFQARSKGGPRGLPKSAGHFVGRDRELECIQERLQDEACRIVSVIGPGGVGKTQLALRIAGLARQFEDGIYFVRLEDTAEGSLPQKLAEDLRLALDPGSDPEQSILGFLAARETLLILDNFEHLTAEAALLSRIADRAPRTKILVTSRKRLNLQQEWIFELKGLPVPEGKSGENPGDFEAVDLFIKSVQRIKDDFFLSDENGEIVAKICRRLEGHPLAIELTSNWLRVLSCQEILQKIEEEATFPQSLMADLPERHRSIERVFESSIRLLTENERTALFRLSALRGFTAESAQQVAGADTATLLSLVDQSLLGREPSGRFGAHSLIRRFASERLKELPDEPESTERLHGEYFFGFLANARRDLRGSGQRKTLEQLREDLDNIRAAWNWAVSNGRMDLVDAALEGLWLFFSATGNYSEGQKMLSQAVERLDGTEALRLRSRLFSRLGRFETALGRLRTAEEYLKNGLSMAEDLNEEEEVALGLLHLSGLSYHLGDFATASRQLHGAIERLDALGDMHGKATALLQLSRIVAAQGDYDAARSHLERALEQFEAEKDQGGVARCLINLGGAEILGEELDKAVSRFEESLRLSKELGDSRRVAVCLGNLGLIHQKKGDLGRSRALSHQAYQMFRDMGLMEAAARSIENMASASLQLGEEDSAFDYLSRGLTLSREIESHPVSLILLTGVAQLLIRKGRVSSALELLALVDSHPRSPDEARIKVQEVATKANLRLSAATGQHSHLDRSLSKIIEEAISECASILEKEKASANEYLERRHHRRFLRAVPCKIEWENGRLRSETADLSLGGARLMAIDKFPPKDSSVKVILGRDALTRTVQATVRHLDISLFPQTFGVEFAQPIQPNDLQQLVAV